MAPLWLFSQSDACRGRTTMVSRSGVSSVLQELSRRGRGSWPVISAPAATATGLSAHETSPLVQVDIYNVEYIYLSGRVKSC